MGLSDYYVATSGSLLLDDHDTVSTPGAATEVPLRLPNMNRRRERMAALASLAVIAVSLSSIALSAQSSSAARRVDNRMIVSRPTGASVDQRILGAPSDSTRMTAVISLRASMPAADVMNVLVRPLFDGGGADGSVALFHSHRGQRTDYVGGFTIGADTITTSQDGSDIVSEYERMYQSMIDEVLRTAYEQRAVAGRADVASWDETIADYEARKAMAEQEGLPVHGFVVNATPTSLIELADGAAVVRSVRISEGGDDQPTLPWEATD